MATLWIQTEKGFVEGRLPTAPRAPADADDVMNAICSEFRIVAFRTCNQPNHVLVTTTDVPVRVNGSIAVGGLRVLRHKDELVTGSQRVFFSAESAPVVEVRGHDDSGQRPRCPICRAEIQHGQTVVRCPGCSRLYHQIAALHDSPAKPCWTYSPTCRFCEHPTSMSGELTWRPDEEEQQ